MENAVQEANAAILEGNKSADWLFKSDQVRLYTVTPFRESGYGVPSFGSRVFTANRPLWSLCHEIGQIQLRVMNDVDARRLAYPSINTVMRLGKALNRAFAVLGGRAKDSEDLRIDGGKGSPVPLAWLMHPVPYFNGDLVRNNWLTQYNELCMFALANAMQHNDNEMALTITRECANAVLIYFQEMKFLVGGELLGMSQEVLKAQGFVFNSEAYAGYEDIASRTLSLEDIDAGTDARVGFTESDLKPLLTGIPSNLIIPNLSLFPVGAYDNLTDAATLQGTGIIDEKPEGEAIQPIV